MDCMLLPEGIIQDSPDMIDRCAIITTCTSKFRPWIQFNFALFIHMQKDVDIDKIENS
jgi:hypothetical protein